MMTKKKVILGSILAVTISTFLAIRFISGHKGIIISEKTVMKAGRKAGFDVDNPSNFGRQIEKKYDELTSAQCRRLFCAILAEKEIPQLIKVLPPNLRKEAISRTAERLRKYRQSMTEEEREELGKKIRSLEGQEMVRRAKYDYFEGYTAEERSEISPVVNEILEILSTL